jgi:hypothetical protein
VEITLGDRTISNKDLSAEPGTGYFREVITAPFLHPEMGNINVTRMGDSNGSQSAAPAWGAAYWQYFEDLNQISAAASGLSIRKNLFRIADSAGRDKLEIISTNQVLRPGTRVMVRIEIRSDRNLEYVHLRDMRAAGMEPGISLSGYRWQGGLSFYQSITDFSNDFFFSRLPQGRYIFEYPLFVSQIGNFSTGIATIQCMYAPHLVSHTEEIRINVEEPVP